MSYRTPNPASLSHDERMNYRNSLVGNFKGPAPEILQDGSAIYTADGEGRFYLHIFAGKALRMLPRVSGWYRAENARANVIERFKQSRAKHHTAKLLRHQAAKQPHTLKVGDVLNTCWGYEQTNVDFYEVVAISGVVVTLREIAASIMNTGFMCGEALPCPGQFIGEPIRRRARASNHVKIHSSANAFPWNGRPQYVSWYA